MTERKLVKEMMMFELRNMTVKNGFLFIVLSAFAIYFFSQFLFYGDFDIVNGNKAASFSTDIMVLAYSFYMITSIRSKAFKLQPLKDGLYASPFMILLRTMPIKDETIIKSRIYLFLLLAILINSLHISIIYFFAPGLQEWITPELFPFWLVIWNMLTLSIGIWMTMSEPGAVYSKRYLTVFSLIFYLLVLLVMFAIIHFTGYGIFGGILYLSNLYPVPTMILSLVLGTISTIFAFYYMKHYMRKVDYHV
ncbi:hypothetical protein [Alkalicoccobacillus murimartini]|uniref:Integral membrane protein n=1 Tax=Alkalicoccobacillus murimartini TaxID=171685 RepID=A0ABT9YHC6_9BACI|nr:hypothetical protein [Alkalicoccobacillus murimartini]MDQ0207101.1 putative integral membrane protein [Alkalicoccobacillus murimartini]